MASQRPGALQVFRSLALACGCWWACNGSGKEHPAAAHFAGLLKNRRADEIISSVRTKTALVFQNPDHQLLLPSCGSELMPSAWSRKELRPEQRRCIDGKPC